MKSALAAITFALTVLTTTAHGAPDAWLNDLDLIDLRYDRTAVEFRYPYPGLSDGSAEAPDCLAVVLSGAHDQRPADGLTALRDAITVTDGPGVLFPNGSRGVNVLDGEIIQERLVYHLKDLGTFVTGLRVETRNRTTLNFVVGRLGFPGIVALQIVRGCRL